MIKAMYAALEQMGLRTGNVLEPACGIGNFMGLVPQSMEGLKMYGVELDQHFRPDCPAALPEKPDRRPGF